MLKYIYFIETYFAWLYIIPFMFSIIGIYFALKFAKEKYMEISGRLVASLFVVLFIVSSGYMTHKVA